MTKAAVYVGLPPTLRKKASDHKSLLISLQPLEKGPRIHIEKWPPKVFKSDRHVLIQGMR